ncbi:hypothetical protein GCM10009504_08170 [Pseudomonas laurentiana]|nr:hypothetical protein GCM10009504_08170 [Pseudomonas laurentiana]
MLQVLTQRLTGQIVQRAAWRSSDQTLLTYLPLGVRRLRVQLQTKRLDHLEDCAELWVSLARKGAV